MDSIILLSIFGGLFYYGFNSNDNKNNNKNNNKITYTYLIKDMMGNHNISQNEWRKNLRITKDLNGFAIGSDEGYILISNNDPITLCIGTKRISLDTYNISEALNKILQIINKDIIIENISNNEMFIINKLLVLLIYIKI